MELNKIGICCFASCNKILLDRSYLSNEINNIIQKFKDYIIMKVIFIHRNGCN